MEDLYYLPAVKEVLPAFQVLAIAGVNPEEVEDPSNLPMFGIYQVEETEPGCDFDFYSATPFYEIVDTFALQKWELTPKPLSVAKVNGSRRICESASARVSEVASAFGLNDLLMGSYLNSEVVPNYLVDGVNEVLKAIEGLNDNLIKIEAATTVEEIQSIVNLG
jgi:hypothetical protein